MQYGALPYRFTKSGAPEILLVTTRQTKRWIIPKGWPIKGLKPAKSADEAVDHSKGWPIKGLKRRSLPPARLMRKPAFEVLLRRRR